MEALDTIISWNYDVGMGSLLGSESLEEEGLVAGDVVVLAVVVEDIRVRRKFAIEVFDAK